MSSQLITDLGGIINTTLMYATPLLFASMGSIFSERGGVVNIAIDGIMTFGAFAGAATAVWIGNPWIAFLIAGLTGGLLGLLHAFASVSCRADQTVSGIALNFLAPGFAVFLCKLFFKGSTQTPPIPLDEKLPRPLNNVFAGNAFLDNVLNNYATVYLAFLLIPVAAFILYRTRFGMRLRAVGEHPKAADTLGIRVARIRYAGVILSGVFAAFGGAAITMATVSNFRPTIVAGQGFIAIAAVIFGRYKPFLTMLGCLLFGLCRALVVYLGNPRIGVNISEHLLAMLPFVITILVLLIFGKSYAPAASGKPYSSND